MTIPTLDESHGGLEAAILPGSSTDAYWQDQKQPSTVLTSLAALINKEAGKLE